MSFAHDHLSGSPAVSALVRRIVFRLNAELHFHGHKPLTDAERASLFDLGDASTIFDGIAVLPGMARAEDRARRDLLDLFNVFDHSLPTSEPAPRGKSVIQSASEPLDALAAMYDGELAAAEAAHHAQLDAREEDAAGDAQGCLP